MIRTDKSGKFCIVSVEDYLKLGKVHIEKDKKITRENLIETEKQLNGHSVAWCKIWNSGADHNHGDRIMSSKVSSSENRATLYPLYKDHKKVAGKTRPVVTGCTSDTRGLSNCVSSFLESVANCNTGDFESISGEDMLSKTKEYNEKIKDIRSKWERRRQTKLEKKCGKCNILAMVENCGINHSKREEKTDGNDKRSCKEKQLGCRSINSMEEKQLEFGKRSSHAGDRKGEICSKQPSRRLSSLCGPKTDTDVLGAVEETYDDQEGEDCGSRRSRFDKSQQSKWRNTGQSEWGSRRSRSERSNQSKWRNTGAGRRSSSEGEMEVAIQNGGSRRISMEEKQLECAKKSSHVADHKGEICSKQPSRRLSPHCGLKTDTDVLGAMEEAYDDQGGEDQH